MIAPATPTERPRRPVAPHAPLPLTSRPAGARATTAPGLRATTLRAGRLLALLFAAALMVAVAVALVPGAPAATRDLLRLDLHSPPGTLNAVFEILFANLGALAPLLLGPPLVAWIGRGRTLLLAYAAWQAGWAVLTVGAALGGYGPPLLAQLAHLPLEWAALAVALVALMPRPTRATTSRVSVPASVTVGALLAVAAAIEVAIP